MLKMTTTMQSRRTQKTVYIRISSSSVNSSKFAGQQWRHRHREQTYGHAKGEEREGGMYGESNMETYITMCKIDSQWEFAVWLRKLKQRLCINLEGWDGEGDGREGTYVYLWLIHADV